MAMVEAERRARARHKNLKPIVDANGHGMGAARRTRRSRSVAEMPKPRISSDDSHNPRAGSALDWHDTSTPDPFFDKALGFLGPTRAMPASLRRSSGTIRKNSTGTSFAAAPHRPSSSAHLHPTAISWDATTTYGKVLHKINVCVDQNLSGGIIQLIERIFSWHAENNPDLASADEITMPQLGDSFLAAGLKNSTNSAAVVTQADLRKLFRALEADGRGRVDMNDLRKFLLGQHHSLSSSKTSVTSDNQSAGVYLKGDSVGDAPSAAAMERTIWIGGIPEALISSNSTDTLRELIGKSAAAQYGDVESVTIRTKAGDKSWGFVIFKQPNSAFSAVAKQSIGVKDWGGSVWSLNVEPLAMRREMAEEWREGNEGGALPKMWRKTVENTAHGKQLAKLQEALEVKSGGMAHSTFRLFKQFQRKGKQPSSGITLEEFTAEAEALNFNLNQTELEALFADLGGDYGGISLDMLYQVLMGSNADLGSAVWEK